MTAQQTNEWLNKRLGTKRLKAEVQKKTLQEFDLWYVSLLFFASPIYTEAFRRLLPKLSLHVLQIELSMPR